MWKGLTQKLSQLRRFLSLEDLFGRFDLNEGRPDRWCAWGKISFVLRMEVLFGWLMLHAFEVVLMMHFFCPAQGKDYAALGSCKLWVLWVHGMACMRRNHINCQVMKNDYKKLGHKKPGLWMEDFFYNFFFCGMTWTGRWAWSPKKVLCTLYPSPLFSIEGLTWNNLRLPGWNKMGLPGWDEIGLGVWK